MAIKITDGEGFMIAAFNNGICLCELSQEEWVALFRTDPHRATQMLTNLVQLFPEGFYGKKIRYKITVEAELV